MGIARGIPIVHGQNSIYKIDTLIGISLRQRISPQ